MKNCIVLLVSDQTIPNVIFLKWYVNNIATGEDDLLFITTQNMEKKNKRTHITNALNMTRNLIKEVPPCIVDENDTDNSIENELKKKDFGAYVNIYVNITGGTKLMSLSCYKFFQNFANSTIFYQPPSNLLINLKDKPCNTRTTKNIEVDISIEEYFASYGITITKSSYSCLKDFSYNKNAYKIVEKNREGVELFRKTFRSDNNIEYKTIDLCDIENNKKKIAGILNTIDINLLKTTAIAFDFDVRNIKRCEIEYLTGGWFEEYVFQRVLQEKKLEKGKQILFNVKIKNAKNVENELDVVYIGKNNDLNVIECKSFIDEKGQKDLLKNTIYQIQALNSDFGLFSKSYLYTMSNITLQNIKNRAETFKIGIFDKTALLFNNTFENKEGKNT